MGFSFSKLRVLKATALVFIFINLIFFIFWNYSKIVFISLPLFNRNHICNFIKTASFSNQKVTIAFKNGLSQKNPKILSSYFAYITSSYNSTLISPPNSAINQEFSQKILTFEFPLVFIQQYTGDLICVKNPEQIEIPPFNIPFEIKKSLIMWTKKNFIIQYNKFREKFQYSQLLCHENITEKMWCEGRKIGIFKGDLLVESPIHYIPPKNLLFLSGKPAFNQRSALSFEPVVTKIPFDKYLDENNFSGKEETAMFCSYFTSEKSQIGMLFEFLFPLYLTMKYNKFNINENNIKFFTRNTKPPEYAELVIPMTKNFPFDISDNSQFILMEKVVIGLVKSNEKLNVSPKVQETSKFVHPFHLFDPNDLVGFRELYLDHYKIKEVNENFRRKIKVVILDSSNAKRKVPNLIKLSNYINGSNKHFQSEIYTLENMELTEILQVVSNADIIIGRTGTPLEHAIWMEPATQERPKYLIELRPNLFTCDDRYESVAKMAKIKYLSIVSNVPVKKQGKKAKCFKKKDVCIDECFTFLKKLEFSVNMTQFKDTWENVMNKY